MDAENPLNLERRFRALEEKTRIFESLLAALVVALIPLVGFLMGDTNDTKKTLAVVVSSV